MRRLATLLACVVLLLSFAGIPAAGVDWQPAGGQDTLFVPLRIFAPAEQQELTRIADGRLTEALERNQLRPFPREAAAPLYQGPWPPPPKELRRLVATPDIQWVVVGSLTRIGQQLSVDLILHSLAGKPSRSWYRTLDSVNDLGSVLQTLTGEVLAATGHWTLVTGVRVTGNERIDSGAILRQVHTQSGDRFDEARLRDDIKAIFKMGYFDDVRVLARPQEEGKEVIFQVREKEVINQVAISGTDEVKEKDVRAVVTVSANTIINDRKIKESVAAIQRLYKEKGFSGTKVTAKLSRPRPGRVNVDFVIDEGYKAYIEEIHFAGNQTFKDKELKKVIETSERGFFSWLTDSGVLHRDVLEQDVARLTAFYHNHGFVDARVGEPQVREVDKALVITFPIEEGRRYRVGRVEITGELIAPAQEIGALVALGGEEFFNRKVLREDITRITDYYADHGYAYAEVTPLVAKDEANGRVDVSLKVTKNDLVRINRIVIRGNSRTRDKVIRREMELKEQEIFNATALRRSSQRLQRLDFFEDVDIAPEPTVDESLLDIIVRVKEKPTGTFSIGAGYSSVDDFMFMGEISQNNFLGKGQRLALTADISGTSTRYNFSFTEPHLNDSDLLFGLDLYNWDREYDDYTKDSTGFALRFGHPLIHRWYLSWSYGYDSTDLTDLDYSNLSYAIRDSLDIHITSYVTVGLSRDSRDHRLVPKSGSLHSIQAKYAGGPLGGDSYFTKVQGSTSWYFPFFFGTTLHLKGALGYVTENTGGKLPVYEKFYLGGINTIRGFKNGQISPRDPATGDRIGGTKMWFFNEELIFPLLKDAGLNGVVFLDAGNVYDTSEDWNFSRLKHSVGAGIRWLSPMGPLRLEWGYNLDPVGDEDHSNWDFTIGGSF